MAIITQLPNYWLRVAAETALNSEHGIYRMGAIIVKGSRVVGYGWNKNKTHPRAKNYTRKIHAELAAIINVGRFLLNSGTWGTEMYVARITNGGSLATSKPCKDCVILMREAGIKQITYIGVDGKICSEKL